MLKDAPIPDLPKQLERELRKANTAVDKAKASYEEASRKRIQLILEADAEYPRSQVAKALGVSVGRVAQIVAKHRSAK